MTPLIPVHFPSRIVTAGVILVAGWLLIMPAVAQQGDVPAGDSAMAELAALDSAQPTLRELPSLPGLFQRALEHDSALARQRYELEAVNEEIPLARSQLLPQVSANASYLYQDSTNIQTDPDGFGLDQPAQRPGEIDERYWQLQLQQPLFSLERWRGLDLARAQVSVAQLQLALVERDLALEVSEAYINAYLASRRLGLLEAQRESLELQTRQAQRAFDLGVGDRINLLEAQSRLDQSISDTVQAENEFDNALSLLERLTGMRPDFSGLQLGSLEAAKVESDWGSVDAWIERTPANLQVLLAREEQRTNEFDTRIRRGGHFPEVNLNLSYSDRDSDDDLRTSEDYRASVEVSVPLYRGGYTTASVRQGELRTSAARESVTNELNLAAQEVRQRLRSLNGSVRQLEALRQAIESSQLFLDAAERGEQLGLRDLVDVLDARANLFDQRIRFVDTIGIYAIDWLALRSAVGELNSADLNNIMALLARITTPGSVEGES
ncbi:MULTISPECIES: TolC family outer membrane protein [Halomonadaceae]|uniref:TolC family outer membrane protein n=1 Tax=Halomonadaceae TaxID=28256 RepID=UPI00159A843A|nr:MULTISPECIES: TolC family outer membrane protein [Halomonas]QJQ96049.1 TolC family outer membrane protein [Halomonas sp. PA5]